MTLATRLTALEAARRRAEAHPSPAAVVVLLGDGEPDPATLAEVEAWTRLPYRERLRLAPWGIGLFEV